MKKIQSYPGLGATIVSLTLVSAIIAFLLRKELEFSGEIIGGSLCILSFMLPYSRPSFRKWSTPFAISDNGRLLIIDISGVEHEFDAIRSYSLLKSRGKLSIDDVDGSGHDFHVPLIFNYKELEAILEITKLPNKTLHPTADQL